METLPKTALKHGAYYEGECRNAHVARWNAEEQRFYHWRYKFGDRFVETILHPADENEADVFEVTAEILVPKEEIPFTGKDVCAIPYKKP